MVKYWGHIAWASAKEDRTFQGDIALDKATCGTVYRGTMNSDYNLGRLETALVVKTTDGKKRYYNGGIAHPDNIIGLSNGSLIVAEDAGKEDHTEDMLWLQK